MTTRLRGRDRELASIRHHLRAAATDGRGAVLLVVGDAGIGKSRLLEEAANLAATLDVRVGRSTASPGDDEAPMASLLAALLDARVPVDLTPPTSRPPGETGETCETIWWHQHVESALDRAARESPLLLCIDDLQWADCATIAVLRALPRRLSARPIVWLIAAREGAKGSAVTRLISRLRACDAETLSLGSFDDATTTQVLADIVGAEPSADLSEFARTTAGHPGLVVALAQGLVDDGLVETDITGARLRTTRIPGGVHDLIRQCFAEVSPTARRAATVAALLGPSVSFEHVAVMLETSPALLLDPVEELVDAGVLAHDRRALVFTSELTRHAITELLPTAARAALQRQAVHVLLDAGVSPAEPAFDLARNAGTRDRGVARTLFAAAEAMSSSDVGAAAALSLHALDVMPADEPVPGARIADTARLLHDAGRAGEGATIADAALRSRLAPADEAEVRLSVARMGALPATVRAEAGRGALALPAVPPALRARHLVQLIDNLLEAGHAADATALLPESETVVAAANDAAAAVALATTKSRLAYAAGAFRDALQHSDVAHVDAARWTRPSGWSADLRRAEALLALDDVEGACFAGADGLARAREHRQDFATTSWARFCGRAALQRGELADASATLADAVSLAGEVESHTVAEVAALTALGRAAIKTGDDGRARACAQRAELALAHGGPEVRRHAAWFLALYASSRGDQHAARTSLVAFGADGEAVPRLMVDVADCPQFVRIALAAGVEGVAREVAAVADERNRLNPDVTSIAAAAAHARGVLDHDLDALEEATELFTRTPRRLARASAHEDFGVELVRRDDRARAVVELGHALQLFTDAGATWDAGRVRGRLRELGVRRRLVRSVRPANGWGGLTDAELAVARLVAEGLTNRQVAEQLFVSPHTVSMHLRHVFTKLDINSRVELTRLAMAQPAAA
jgi:DNA-binding CsgD family transcriptional regulator